MTEVMNIQGGIGYGKIDELVEELQRQEASKADFVVDARDIEIRTDPDMGVSTLRGLNPQTQEWLGGEGTFIPLRSLKQAGQRQTPDIPAKFMERLSTSRPEQFDKLMNGLWQTSADDGKAKRLTVRCLDERVRAVLSGSYAKVDHLDVLWPTLEAAKRVGAMPIQCSLTDSHMRIKFTTNAIGESLQGDGRGDHVIRNFKGNKALAERLGQDTDGNVLDEVRPLVTISNSETGDGAWTMSFGVFEAACANGYIFESLMRNIHIGADEGVGHYSDRTKNLDAMAMLSKIEDNMTAAFDPKKFRTIIAKMRDADAVEVADPPAAVRSFCEDQRLPDKAADSLLTYFLKDYNSSKLGLAQAVTRYAQDVEPDKADDLQRAAGALVLSS